MDILKNSEKYTVFKIKKKNKTFILKVSNRKPLKIFKEINHIKKLKKSSFFFNKKIPSITEHGKISKGINKHKGYYLMNFVKGPTLSEIFQKNLLNIKKREKLLNEVLSSLINEIKIAKLTKKKNSFELFKKLFKDEYSKILKKDIFKNLLNRKKILINNKIYHNISHCLNVIFNTKKIKSLKKYYNSICFVNHWNFHGGNIIFPKKKINKFMLIDPDSSWKYNDPFFSIARLIYTYPHDTMEYDKYFLVSKDFLKKIKKKPISFKIKYNWGSKIKKNYESIFSNFYNNFDKKNLIFSKLSETEFLRFNLSLILCFLRGINANYQPKVNFLMDKSNNFQNKGLFIYLFFLIFLNKFTKKIS